MAANGYGLRGLRLSLFGFVILVMVPVGVLAQAPEAGPTVEPPKGTVLTFYGLRRLEQDPSVSDEKKVEEWRSFIERAKQQVAYAEKAVERWTDAAKLRLVESARLTEQSDTASKRQQIAQWNAVIDAYPRSPEASHARRRIDVLRGEETARLVEVAEAVESSGRPKVDRIQAWLSVVLWSPRSKPARAAEKRIDALQRQLFKEAESVDRIERLDLSTKLEAWKDVLRGRPTKPQRRKAEARIEALEAAISG